MADPVSCFSPLPVISDAALRLASVPGLGAVRLGRLRQAFATPGDLLAAGPAAWREAEISERFWPALDTALTADVAQARGELERSGAWALSVFDPQYPALLKEIHDPPPLLYGLGDPGVLHRPCVAVVGSRKPTPYGIDHARFMARRLAESGYTVVSGLAMGIDSLVHRSALEAGGHSAAVLGSGVSNIYPPANQPLAAKLTETGVVLSECTPWAPAERGLFPRRNRIISGLSLAVVVIEARPESGSLITARQGLEQGREIFIVPGPAGGPNLGGHRLLKDGANWAEDAADVLKNLAPLVEVEPHPPGAVAVEKPVLNLPPGAAAVWPYLEPVPVHIDVLIGRSGLRSAEVLGILLQLELCGQVRQLNGKFFIRSV